MAKWNIYQHKSGKRDDNMYAADQIFKIQKESHPFSDQVMRAARKVKQYIATPQDIAIIRAAIGDQVHDVNVPFMTTTHNVRNQNKHREYNKSKWAAQGPPGGVSTSNPSDQSSAPSSTQSANPSAPKMAAAHAETTDSGVPMAAQPIRIRTSKVVKRLARKISGFAKSGADVPDSVGAAVQRVYDNQGTVRDNQTIRNFLHIRRTGSTASKMGFASITNIAQDIGEYAALLRAGPLGVAGAVGKGVNDIQRLVKNKDFKELVVKSVGGALADRAVANAFFREVGMAAKVAGASAGFLAAGYAGVKGLVRTAEWLGGLNMLGDDTRQLRARARISALDTGHSTAQERQLDQLLLKQNLEELSGKALAKDAAVLASNIFLAGLKMPGGVKSSGQKEQEIEETRTRMMMYEHGLTGGMQAFRERSRERMFRKEGFVFGAMHESWDKFRKGLGMPSAETERAITAQGRENLNEAARYKAMMYQRISEGDFKTAKALGEEANRAAGTNYVWSEPQVLFVNMDNARGASRLFPMTQSMRRIRSYE